MSGTFSHRRIFLVPDQFRIDDLHNGFSHLNRGKVFPLQVLGRRNPARLKVINVDNFSRYRLDVRVLPDRFQPPSTG